MNPYYGNALNSVSIIILVIDACLQPFLEERHSPFVALGKKCFLIKLHVSAMSFQLKSGKAVRFFQSTTSDKHLLHIVF